MRNSKGGVKIAALACLVTATFASPVHRAHDSDQSARHLLGRGPDEIKDAESWCGLAEELNLSDNGDEALARTSLGDTLDMFIMQVNKG